ncbi:hypothetical protein DY000_02041214 [Brassica cretica]|uniref:Uncharacterized protein n=1 Tax=Brassica cretica TaxID=69181 RepID=A0ABQ7BEF5_BRACR|nr:hypothetical protein DY000_02041214 [Brassica cretica]
MTARGLVSIDVRVKLSIVALSQVSIDVVEVVSIDVVEVVSIDAVDVVSIDVAHFSLRIEHSKRDGSEKKSYSSLLLLVRISMYRKDKKFFYVTLACEQGMSVDRCYGMSVDRSYGMSVDRCYGISVDRSCLRHALTI